MSEKRTSLYLPPEVERAMKQLADGHDRSLNGEIVQACRAWIEIERKSKMAFHPTPEQIDAWADAMLEEATDDMSEKDIAITPESLSKFFQENYELAFTMKEAEQWLSTRDWYASQEQEN